MDSNDRIVHFEKFFEEYYLSKITENVRLGKKRVTIEFKDLAQFNPELADDLIEHPEDTLKCAELALEKMDIEDIENTKVRIRGDIPESKFRIRDLRAMHLNRFVTVEGTIETKTEMGIKMTSSKYECPSCLPKGTLVLTPNGYTPIEKVNEILSLDENFKLITTNAKVIHTGKKQIWTINNQIQCSGEHKWFVYQNGITKVIQTKHLKRGGIFYRINYDDMYYMQKGIQPTHLQRVNKDIKKINLFPRMQKEILQSISTRWGKNKIKQQRNNQIIHRRKKIIDTDIKHIKYKPQNYKKKINKIQYTIKNSFRTMQNKCEKFNYLQAWKKLWKQRWDKISEKTSSMEMQKMWCDPREISKEGFSSTSHKQKTSRQQSREFDDTLSITPFKIASVNKTTEDTEMYDLIIPRYNNFIILGGIVTHNCGNILSVLQLGDELLEPKICGCGRKGKFHLISKELIDCFTLRLQELSTAIRYGSNMPVKSILCKGDLTDPIIEEKLIEGIRIKINGIYQDKLLIKSGKKQTQLITYIEANYIQISEETFYDIELTQDDIEEIKEFSNEPNLMETIAEGLFQGVHGFYKIKEALTLQAFGGVSDYTSIPHTRGDIHIALIGDAGQNKSVFEEFACNFNPKSVLVVGKSVSAVGLRGAVIKDELSGSYVLKPGAIPLADNGLICIDELDKMRFEDRDILHEPMEQQTIHISIANLSDRRMLARCAFLVSMNPKNAYFNDIDPI